MCETARTQIGLRQLLEGFILAVQAYGMSHWIIIQNRELEHRVPGQANAFWTIRAIRAIDQCILAAVYVGEALPPSPQQVDLSSL